MLIAIVPFLIAIVGVITYVVATRSEVKEIGKICFFCGLLVLTFVLANHTVRVG